MLLYLLCGAALCLSLRFWSSTTEHRSPQLNTEKGSHPFLPRSPRQFSEHLPLLCHPEVSPPVVQEFGIVSCL